MHLVAHQQTKFALGSDTTITVVSDAAQQVIEKMFARLWLHIYTFEKQFSRFLPSSELSQFNQSAGVKRVVSPAFRDLLKTSKKLALQTEGLYNPFILPALQKAGYLHSAAPGYEEDTVDDFSHHAVVGVDKLEIDETWARIPYGTAIDMGGCGKGYLADQLAALLKNKRIIVGFWISLGGDVYAHGTNEHEQPWQLHIQDAQRLDHTHDWFIESTPKGVAVATSGTFRRTNQNGKNWHHIIDPLTLQPAHTDIRLATVCAPSAVQADVIASCTVILGSDKSRNFLAAQHVKTYMLQCEKDGEVSIIRHGDLQKELSGVMHA